MAKHRYIKLALALASTGALIGGLLVVPAGATAPSGRQGSTPVSYVALGDSYTSGPLIQPAAPGAPADCLRSAVNYPHLTAATLGLVLTDRSCSGATTADMTTSQYLDQSPQFDSLRPSTGVVTIGIGGDDNGLFVDALLTCAAIDIFDPFGGSPCKAVKGSTYTDDIRTDASTVGAAFARIHTLSPSARIFVVGYPDILPQHGNCYPSVPLTTGDTAYLNGIEVALNSMLRSEAISNGATYVDTYTPSIGHDACQPESVRWVEPPIPSTDALPVHPNSRGEAADAHDIEAALLAAGVG